MWHPLQVQDQFMIEIEDCYFDVWGEEVGVDGQAEVIYCEDDGEIVWEFNWVRINFAFTNDGSDLKLTSKEEQELIEEICRQQDKFEKQVWSEIQDRLN